MANPRRNPRTRDAGHDAGSTAAFDDGDVNMDTRKSDYHLKQQPSRPDEIQARLEAWRKEYKEILESGEFEEKLPAFLRLLCPNRPERREPRKKKKRQLQTGLPPTKVVSTVYDMQTGETRIIGES